MTWKTLATLILAFLSPLLHAEIDLVKVDKSLNTVFLLDGAKVVKQYHAAFGAQPKGHKLQEGDEKTPEGKYKLDYVKEDSAYYRAMHISYPNRTDIERSEQAGVSPGGQIMVHGQRNGLGWLASITQKFNWTDGCIALANDEMDEFLQLVAVGTPIEIAW